MSYQLSDIIDKDCPDLKFKVGYKAWSDKIRKKFPVTDEHINKFVRLADDPTATNKYKLLEIKEPGSKLFKHGGFILQEGQLEYPKPVFADEIISIKVKSRVTSQLALSKKRKKINKKGNKHEHISNVQ